MRHRFIAHPLVVRRLHVVCSVDVTSRMRRITLAGEQLGSFERDGMRFGAFLSPGFDDHVKLVFAADGDIESVLPTQLEHGIEWQPAENRVTRDYTPRRTGEGELDLDFVLHAETDGSGARPHEGPAERWAREAVPGDALHVVGPKSSSVLPRDADRVVLIGDETALPAIGRFFEERPIGGPVRAVIAVADDCARQELAVAPGDVVDWVVAEPGDPGALAGAVRAIGDAPFKGMPYVWAGAESRALLPVRRLVSRTLGVPRSHTDITGYWHVRADEGNGSSGAAQAGRSRRSEAGGFAESRDRDPAANALTGTVPSSAATAAAPAVRSPSPSPVAWFAVRAALQLGLIDALDDGVSATPDLAERCDLEPRALEPLLSVLARQGLIEIAGGGARLTEGGAELAVDEHAREEFVGVEAAAVVALAELAPALRRRESPWRTRYGATLEEQAAETPELREALADEAGQLAYLAPALVTLPVWRGADAVRVEGPGAEIVADALRELSDGPRIFDGAGGAPQVVVLALGLEHRTDAEAADLLRRVAGSDVAGPSGEREASPEIRAQRPTTLVVIESTAPDALSPHAVEAALVRVGVTGTPPRSAARLAELAATAAWCHEATTPLGWGVEALTFRAAAR